MIITAFPLRAVEVGGAAEEAETTAFPLPENRDQSKQRRSKQRAKEADKAPPILHGWGQRHFCLKQRRSHTHTHTHLQECV